MTPRQASRAARLVIGIPSVPRAHGYVERTVRSVVAAVDADTVLVVLNAADPADSHVEISRVRDEHRALIEGGRLCIIEKPHAPTPPGDFPPAGEDEHAAYARWMTQHNLDVAFLMNACTSRGDFYVHLEDDVIAADGWLATFREWKARHFADNASWDMLCLYSPHVSADCARVSLEDFFGAMGLLFRTGHVPALARYIRAHSADAPNDWLIRDYLLSVGARVYARSPSLFQHVGVVSSNPWRVQLVESPSFPERWFRRQRRVVSEVLVLLRHRPRRVLALIAARVRRGSGQ